MECYPAIKKQNNEKKNAILATLMDLEMIILNEVSQKKTNSIRYHYMWNLKYGTNEPIYETETDLENRPVVAKREGEGVE